jgi:hypothetical protein
VSLGTSGVLAQLYAALSGKAASSAWAGFLVAVKALPAVRSDDPFGALGAPTGAGSARGRGRTHHKASSRRKRAQSHPR